MKAAEEAPGTIESTHNMPPQSPDASKVSSEYLYLLNDSPCNDGAIEPVIGPKAPIVSTREDSE